MGSREGALQGFKSFVVFTAGRIFMCGVLGLASGYMGTTLINTDIGFRYVSMIYSGVMVSIGLIMLFKGALTTLTSDCDTSAERPIVSN